jgi:hypothetical protein
VLKGLSVSLPGAFGSWGLLAAVGTFSCGFPVFGVVPQSGGSRESKARSVVCFTKTVQPWILCVPLSSSPLKF